MIAPRLEYLLSSASEVDALRRLKSARVVRIGSDGVSFWFDLGLRHLYAPLRVYPVQSTSGADEALALRPEWSDTRLPLKGTILFENEIIEDVRIVRTALWFTEPESCVAKTEGGATKGPTTGLGWEWQEVVTNPSRIASVEAPSASIVDVGFIAAVCGRRLACFTQFNHPTRSFSFVDDFEEEFKASYGTLGLDRALCIPNVVGEFAATQQDAED